MPASVTRLPFGVEVQEGTACARVWAPACDRVELVVERDGERVTYPMEADRTGSRTARVEELREGDRYWFLLDGERLRPDPYSRYQPEGPHGPSEVVNPARFAWTDQSWRGIPLDEAVLYEMHVGTFTEEGTWRAAAGRLPALADLGVTVIEMMPVAEFAGRFGWGYDGVDLFAPTHNYGRPDDLRAFVDRAHALGLAVILDVVYNHLGPDGNYLEEFSPDYFTDKYKNDWGRPINFEGPPEARALFVSNAGYWIDEFHFDGLRFDATQDMHDASREHVLATMARRARSAAGDRRVLLIAENEPQDTRLIRGPAQGGYGLDAVWNDDFHHTAVAALTGRREAYYRDYTGSPQELVACAKYGFLYQGQYYTWQKKRRGTPSLDLPGRVFITYLENHDQVANSAFGRRLHQLSSPGRYRALTALWLLGPGTPMLFQGQELGVSSPFLYFADHRAELRESIVDGRRTFLEQFPSVRDAGASRAMADPAAETTFRQCVLPSAARDESSALALHRDLLQLRRTDAVLGSGSKIDGAVLAPHALVLRWSGGDAGDRLLVVNMGVDLDLAPVPEPLLAPPANCRWALLWSSEAVAYGGQGTAPITPEAEWHLPGESAILLGSAPEER